MWEELPTFWRRRIKTQEVVSVRILWVIVWITISLGVLNAQRTLIYCDRLIDGQRDKALTNKTIVVSGDKIEAIRDGFVAPG